MNINDAFPSKYLSAADLQGREPRVVIDRVEMDTIGDKRKMIVFFQNKTKGMVLNKTNANNIAVIYGADTDEWAGREIILFTAMVDFQGKTVPAIRVKPPLKANQNITTSPKRVAVEEEAQDAPF